MKPNIGIEPKHREGVIELLNPLLADEYILYTKLRNYHWNVVGPQFNDLHKFFQEQYEALTVAVDEIAERATTLGGHAVGTLAEFVQLARLKEHPARYPEAREMLANVLADHEAIIRTLRQDLEAADEQHHDMGTHDYLTGLMQRHEKMAWMVRAFLESTSA